MSDGKDYGNTDTDDVDDTRLEVVWSGDPLVDLLLALRPTARDKLPSVAEPVGGLWAFDFPGFDLAVGAVDFPQFELLAESDAWDIMQQNAWGRANQSGFVVRLITNTILGGEREHSVWGSAVRRWQFQP